MLIIRTIDELKKWRLQQQTKISFIPTMGFLHEGHLSLIKKAHQLSKVVVVSIFINPLQFNNAHDLDNYPEKITQDLDILKERNVDMVFLPAKEEVYPNGEPKIKLVYPTLMKQMCGKYRENHFEGVLLICYKFFCWLQPQFAIFGLKDYQQYRLVKQMSIDLELGVDIIASPLIRDENGLALSSRNSRLSPIALKKSLLINKTLFEAKKMLEEKQKIAIIREFLQKELIQNTNDYADVYLEGTLTPIGNQDLESTTILIAAAVTIDGVRLIDNILIHDYSQS